MPSYCFADRLGELTSLTQAERGALARLEERERSLRRGNILQREHDRSTDLYILREGMMMTSVLLDDGSRQILRFLFPGDMLALSSLVYSQAPETTTALTDCTVCPFDRHVFSQILVDHPRLAGLVMVYNQIERVALTDRLAALGRTSAKARVATLLMEMHGRRHMADKRVDGSFVLGLTQEEIGDATGLTAVHVNRMLRQLEDEKLIAREGGRLTLLDERTLERSGNYVNRYANLDLAWLPASR